MLGLHIVNMKQCEHVFTLNILLSENVISGTGFPGPVEICLTSFHCSFYIFKRKGGIKGCQNTMTLDLYATLSKKPH